MNKTKAEITIDTLKPRELFDIILKKYITVLQIQEKIDNFKNICELLKLNQEDVKIPKLIIIIKIDCVIKT